MSELATMEAAAPAQLFAQPLLGFAGIDNDLADTALVEWAHWLGGCNRPFGRQSFGLFLNGDLVSVAVSASTVNARCGGYRRSEVVELARLCSHPDHRDLTRPMLRLWRKVAADLWPHWEVSAYVSYADATRHKGDIYRFDGWSKVADVRGGSKVNHGHRVEVAPKTVWAFELRQPDQSTPHRGGDDG